MRAYWRRVPTCSPLGLELLPGMFLVDQGVVDLPEGGLDGLLIPEKQLLLDGLGGLDLPGNGAGGEDRGGNRDPEPPSPGRAW